LTEVNLSLKDLTIIAKISYGKPCRLTEVNLSLKDLTIIAKISYGKICLLDGGQS
jgi:hypothetical protein